MLTGVNVSIPGLGSTCSPKSAVALLGLASQFSAPSEIYASWDNATNPSTWEGVACNGQGEVATLDLGGYELEGRSDLIDKRCAKSSRAF